MGQSLFKDENSRVLSQVSVRNRKSIFSLINNSLKGKDLLAMEGTLRGAVLTEHSTGAAPARQETADESDGY